MSDLPPNRYVYSLAGPADDAEIRTLLREVVLEGSIRLTFEREPDAFAGGHDWSLGHGWVLAREGCSGRAVAVCERTVHEVFVDGQVVALPYLGALRVLPAHRHRIRLIRDGFAAVRSLLYLPVEPAVALTSIAADNDPARRLLLRGLPGLPRYVDGGELTTFALPCRRRAWSPAVGRATPADRPGIARFLEGENRRLQFAPLWTEARLAGLAAAGEVAAEDFVVTRQRDAIAGSVAVWDARARRQVVVRGYSGWLGRMRPLVNGLAMLNRGLRLPPPGQALRYGFLSHFAPGATDGVDLVNAALDLGWRRGLEVLLLGLCPDHPLASVVRRTWHPREYRTTLHVVDWDGAWGQRPAKGKRLPQPEIAML